jgi:hypothetical protein
VPLIRYKDEVISVQDSGPLTRQQHEYYQKHMAAQCPVSMLTTATNQITWYDSAGLLNASYYRQGTKICGPIVPIVAQETLLVLARSLHNAEFQAQVAQLTPEERRLLAGTTTDKEAEAIFHESIESARKAIVQHALLIDETMYTTPAEFVWGMVQSGIFLAIGANNYWDLQASTAKKGMVYGHFEVKNGNTRLTHETTTTKRAMKYAKIQQTKEVMYQALQDEGMSVEAALQKYAHEQEQVIEQYVQLPDGEYPYCLGMMPHQLAAHPGQKIRALNALAPRFAETFEYLVTRIHIEGTGLEMRT